MSLSSKRSGSSGEVPSIPPDVSTAEEIVQQFFNQMVEYIIEDLVYVKSEEELETLELPAAPHVGKNYTEIKEEDFRDGVVVSASGSKVNFTSSKDSTDYKKFSNIPQSSKLDVILEETETSETISSTTRSSFLQEKDSNVKIIFKSGNTYQGKFSDGTMNGIGKYCWTDGSTYEGSFLDGYPTGKGKMVLPDLSVYHGEFKEGLFHGQGFLNVVSTPTFYNGDWKNGKRHGCGWLLYQPGDWYEGNWAQDMRAGFGIRKYLNGTKYRGSWHHSRIHGEGTMVWENNDYYKGSWSEGLMHGEGEYIWDAFYNDDFTFPLQNSYKGAWINGKRSGEGMMIFGDESGIKFRGIWHEGLKHGPGILVCGSGQIIKDNFMFYFDKPVQVEGSICGANLENYKALNIPLFAPPENVDIGFYIDNILEKLSSVNHSKLRILKHFEDKCVKNLLIRYLPRLKELYQMYATIASKRTCGFKAVLIRLFLWQLYKDKAVHLMGLSLADTDLILAENPKSCVENPHDPFEPLYFWQFLMSLIGVALKTADLETVFEDYNERGVCAFLIRKFFDEVLFVNSTDYQGFFLKNYLDYAPIKSVYELYKKLGEPHTARTFLRKVCERQICPQFYVNLVKIGTNFVPLDHHVVFEAQGDEVDFERKINDLTDLQRLGPKIILKCIAKVCPLIIQEGLVVQMDYRLVFLEFYEALLSCIFTYLELEMKKEARFLQMQTSSVLNTNRSKSSRLLIEQKAKKNKNKK